MQASFPEQIGLASMFLLGFRKSETGETRRAAAAIVKRTYRVEPPGGRMVPSDDPLPILMQDLPDNLVVNSDFESLDQWKSQATLQLFNAGNGHQELRVTGPPNEPIVQTIPVEKPSAGEPLVLSFVARRGLQPAVLQNVRVELADGVSICSINATLSSTRQRFSAIGHWPANVSTRQVRVVLRTPTVAQREAFYDQIQLERRGYRTRWDPAAELKFEHDLAPYKPEADIIVLGFTDAAGLCQVRVDGQLWTERHVSSTADGEREKAVFGWARRVGSPRQTLAGTFPPDPEAYPPQDPLPADFSNLFYNGHRAVDPLQPTPSPRLPTSARVEVLRTSASDYRLQLPDTQFAASYYVADRSADAEPSWTRHGLAMQVDTLVVEPERHRCSLTWRGTWDWEDHPADLYRRLIVRLMDPGSA